VTFPVSTRSDLGAREGLSVWCRRLLRARVPSLVVEAPSPERPAAFPNPEAVAALSAPILAFVGSPRPSKTAGDGTIASIDKDVRAAVAADLAQSEAWLAAARCRRLLVPIGPAGISGEDALRREFAQNPESFAERIREFKAKNRSQRQAHAEVVCRVLYDLLKRLDGVGVHVLSTDDPLCFLDVETAEWILGDLKGLRLALDTGVVWSNALRGGDGWSDWAGLHARALGFMLLSDHDGRGDGRLLPGAGRGDFSVLRDSLGADVPLAIRCDPRASLDDVLASVEETTRRLGKLGDART
jgi:hypothetical protein